MSDLPDTCSALLCGREGAGMITGYGVHNASLRIFNLLWERPEEDVGERFSLLAPPATGLRERRRPLREGDLGLARMAQRGDGLSAEVAQRGGDLARCCSA